jgi:hypothetical protein
LTKTVYRQRLPHFQPIGAVFFITFRLFGSIPFYILNKLHDEFEIKINSAKNEKDNIKRKNHISIIRQEYFLKFDFLLDKIEQGPNCLAKVEIQNIVKEQLH